MILSHVTYRNTCLPFSNIWTVQPRSSAAAMGTTLTLTSGSRDLPLGCGEESETCHKAAARLVKHMQTHEHLRNCVEETKRDI